MGRFPWQCNSRWSGAWLYVAMGANQFVFLLVFGVRKPWFHPVACCCGVLLLTLAPELVSEAEGSTPTPWVSARLPRFSWLVGWACFSSTPRRTPPPPRAGWEVTGMALSQGPSCGNGALGLLSLLSSHAYTPSCSEQMSEQSALTSWGSSKGP